MHSLQTAAAEPHPVPKPWVQATIYVGLLMFFVAASALSSYQAWHFMEAENTSRCLTQSRIDEATIVEQGTPLFERTFQEELRFKPPGWLPPCETLSSIALHSYTVLTALIMAFLHDFVSSPVLFQVRTFYMPWRRKYTL